MTAKEGMTIQALREIASRKGCVRWLRSGLIENLERKPKSKAVYAGSEYTFWHPLYGGNKARFPCEEVPIDAAMDLEQLAPKLPLILEMLKADRDRRRKDMKAAARRRFKKLKAEEKAKRDASEKA